MTVEETLETARAALLAADPAALEACLPALANSVAGLRHCAPATRRKARLVQNLLDSAIEFHRGWMNVRGALSGYDHTGAPSLPDPGGRVRVHA